MASTAPSSPPAALTPRLRYLLPFVWTAPAPAADAWAALALGPDWQRLVPTPPCTSSALPPDTVGVGDLDELLPHAAAFLFPPPTAPPAETYSAPFALAADACQRRFPRSLHLALADGAGHLRVPVHVTGTALYLFRSGVGVLTLDVEIRGAGRPAGHVERFDGPPPEPVAVPSLPADPPAGTAEPLTPDLLIRVHAALRSATHRAGTFLHVSEPAGPRTPGVRREHTSRASTLADEMAALLGETLDGAGLAWQPAFRRRLLVYSVALVPPAPPDDPGAFERLHAALRHGYDAQHRPAPSDLRLDANPEVVQTFEPVFFGCTPEGGTVLIHDTGDAFIRDDLPVRALRGYFWIYLLALHQRLAAQHLAERVAHVARARRGDPAGLDAIRAVRDDVFDFRTRARFADVVTRRTYGAVYRRWLDVLLVVPLTDEVESKAAELDAYVRRAHADTQAAHDRDQATRDRERLDAQDRADRQQATRDREQADRDRQQVERDRKQADAQATRDRELLAAQKRADRQQAERDRERIDAQALADRQQAERDRQQAERDRARAVEDRRQSRLLEILTLGILPVTLTIGLVGLNWRWLLGLPVTTDPDPVRFWVAGAAAALLLTFWLLTGRYLRKPQPPVPDEPRDPPPPPA